MCPIIFIPHKPLDLAMCKAFLFGKLGKTTGMYKARFDFFYVKLDSQFKIKLFCS